jgi:hypothetical protein
MSTHKQDNVLAIYLKKQMTKLLMEISLALHPKHPLVRASVLALLLGSTIMLKPHQAQTIFTDRFQVQRTLPDRMVLMTLGSKN